MCVVALAWQAHPRWQLIVAANRDELHDRPASPLARWNAPDHVVSGTDLQSGGTWLGISDQGRFAAVTNLRGYGGPQPGRASRGALVADVLSGRGEYADPAKADLSQFNPFNLITASPKQMFFLTNRPETTHTPLGRGIYGLSNGMLDEPWSKTIQLKAFVLEWIVAGSTQPELLFDGLYRDTLPEFGVRAVEPSDAPLEPTVSPIFIRNPVYGTRCSTVVAIDSLGKGIAIERSFTRDGNLSGEASVSFSWPG